MINSKKDYFSNKFLNNLNQYSKLDNINDLPNIDSIIYHYSSQVKENFKQQTSGFKLFYNFIIRFFQFIEIFFLCFGWCLPYNLLKYHIFYCVIKLVLWEIFDNKNLFDFLTYSNNKKNKFLSIDHNICLTTIFFTIFLSLFSIIFPENTIFSYIYSFIKFLSIYKYK